MKSAILSVVHVVQVAFGIYNLYLAADSINKLLGYEDMSKKAAKYSKTAEKQLHMTRSTQASGTIAKQLLISTLSAAYMLVTLPPIGNQGMAGLNMLALVLARKHVGNFWSDKPRVPVPGAGDFNEAAKKTQEVMMNLAIFAATWFVVGGVDLLFAAFES
ncbi:uncharacterized protein RSE6_09053 [Rhynchosporium secalis]|uniref:Uncharacterized protein n=1 Tax=Rhynchosporium secalis TaxID=38038 RepID=A0A1E1MGY9_RHYSE|nr:uncharacterized protein RSE6_09053 [Rhynchosporium secalis]